MTSFTKRNRRQRLQAGFERRHRWNRSLLMGSTGLGGVLAGLALGAGGAWAQPGANTLPTNGQVTAGSATINQSSPNTLNINQTTNRAVINWSSFDVGTNASVNFYQPNAGSWTINRVTNSIAPSTILGHITANGNIAVINSNGVIFGAGSRVDVNGLVATTANISDKNFMAGNMKFDQAGSGTATVQNFGDITVKDAGLVAFVAPGVSNSGTINARLGKVSLAGGQKFTLDLYGDKLVSIAADGAVTEAPIGPNGQKVAALVDNSGKIVAEGGQIQLTAKQASRLVDNAVNMSGVVQAQSAYVSQNGDIVLDAGPAGNVVVTGTVDASGKGAGQKGGNVTITGKDNVLIAGTAKIDASGNAGGGKIKIGGDFHGQGTTPTAKNTTVAAGAQINANAINTGNGGQVVVWSDDTTTFTANISARGGDISGNGGNVEISSKNLILYGSSVDTRAAHGATGNLLLDPTSVTILSGANDAVVTGGVIHDGTLNNLLTTANVTVMTSSWGDGGPGDGVIQINSSVVLNLSGNKLTLIADNDLGASISTGTINILSTVAISNGMLELQAGTVHLNSTIAAAISNAGANAPGQVFVDSTSAGIQNGIDIAGTGGTVHVVAGTFDGNLVIGKALTLDGAGVMTIIRPGAGSTLGTISDTSGSEGGTASNNLITVNASNVTISNLKLDGDNTSINSGLLNGAGADINVRNGIMVGFAGGVSNVTVDAVTVTNFYKRGVQFNSGTGNLIQNSTVNWGEETNNSIGIFFFAASGNATNNHLDHAGITDNQTTNWTATGNTLTNSLGGIHADNGSGAQIISGNDVSLLATGYGVWAFVPQAGSMVTISGNTVTGGAVGAAVLGGNSTATVVLDNNSITGASGAGIYVTNNSFGFGTFNTKAILTNNKVTVSAVGAVGILIEDADVGGQSTTAQIGTGNVVSIGNVAGIGLQVSGADTSLVGNTLSDLQFLSPSGPNTFIVLSGGALFGPGNPTNIDAKSVGFDLNNNGTIDAGETAAGFDPTTVNNQMTLDAFWGVGGFGAFNNSVAARITDYRDDQTLGLISPLGSNVVVVNGTGDFGGGLRGVQNAINITPLGGYLFVNNGDYGAPSPFPGPVPAATTPLTLNQSIHMIGRQGFTSAATGGRNFSDATTESILDFAAVPAVTGGVNILSGDTNFQGFVVKASGSQTFGIQVNNSGNNLIVDNNFVYGSGTNINGNGISTGLGIFLDSGDFTGNNVFNVTGKGIVLFLSGSAASFTLQDNRVKTTGGLANNAIEINASVNAGTSLLLQNNIIEGAGGNAILVTNFGQITIANNTIASTIAATVGGDGIRINGTSTDSTVSGNTIAAGAGNLLAITGAGIHLSNPAANFSVSGNTIGSGSTGIFVDGASSPNVNISIISNTINNVTKDGITVFNQGNNNENVLIGTTTIAGVGGLTGAGIDVVDNSGTGITSVQFLAGDIIDAAPNGVIFDGKDTRIVGQTFGDLVIGSTIGSVAPLAGEFYIQLKNKALYGTGPVFTPLQYDVSNVTFNGVMVASLNPEFYNPSAAIDSDREVLGQLEAKIFHYFDDSTLGFIRLKTNSVTLDPTAGLNGVQLAITVSSKVNVDNLYLLPGTYGDPSDLLNNATLGTTGSLLVDRNIRIIGAQGPRDAVDGPEDGIFTIPGVSAKTGGRTFADPTTESILNFNLATVTGVNQGGILISGNAGTTVDGPTALVSIDGVDIQMGVGDKFGIRIDSSVVRSNITLVDNFVLGIGVRINGSAIDNNGGAQLLTNVTIKDNSIANASVAGISITNAIGVAVQNNSVQFVGADGISVLNSHFSTSVSGNMVDSTGFNGIIISGQSDVSAANDVTVQANSVSNTGTVAGSTGDGIHVGTLLQIFNNVLVGDTSTLAAGLGNTVNNVGVGAGSSGDGIEVFNALGNVTVARNTIANTGTIAGNGIVVSSTAGSVSIDRNTIASGADVFANGIFVGLTLLGDVVVTSNTIGTAANGTVLGNGVFISGTDRGKVTVGGATSSLGNTINHTGSNGISVQDTGDGTFTSGKGVLVQFNTIGNLAANIGTSVEGGNGIFVINTKGGDVTVLRNTIGNLLGNGPRQGTLFEGDGILVDGTANNVQVGDIVFGGPSPFFTSFGNTVYNAQDDGIEVRDTGLTVKVIGNLIKTVGTVATTGDGIIVTNTGTAAGVGDGNVTVLSNTVTNVTGNGAPDATDGLTSGDGIRVSKVDGNVMIAQDAFVPGNSIFNVGDDGIQVNNVRGTVNISNNAVTLVGTGTGNGGDGIQVDKVGRLSSYSSTIVPGSGVEVDGNTINGTSDTGIDADDGLTAGDGIRIAHIDGTAGASGNVIANLVGGGIANDGIQVYDVTRGVAVGGNSVGSANASIGILTPDGDGIVVENTGAYATTLGVANSGDVAVNSNSIMNVIGSNFDRDGASNATVILNAPHQFLTAGDGIRVAFADGAIQIGLPSQFINTGNRIQTVGNDGIEVFYVTGQTTNMAMTSGVQIGRNDMSTIGVNTTDGDGIQVSHVGQFGGGTGPVETDIVLNAVNNVIGTGLDRDDGLTAGDGIRGSYLNGLVLVSRNEIGATGPVATFAAAKIGNDGIQLWNIAGNVTVLGNKVGTGLTGMANSFIGNDTNDGDGIVVENTGTFASAFGTVGGGSVAISGNFVSNVRGNGAVGAPTADRDGDVANTTHLTSGDGIRVAFVDGTVAVGLTASGLESFSATGNSIDNVADDGIQVFGITRTVNVSNNAINSVGVFSTMGDGVQIDRTGTGGVGHDGDGSVTVQNNSISNVATGSGGVGINDSDDTISSNDGIRVSIVDGDVVIGGAGTLGNRIANTRDDGIEVFDVERTVQVLNNTINNVGAGSNAGDGITVLNTGRYASNTTALSGGVTVSNNTISNVIGNGGVLSYDARSQGDGIRIANTDGNALFSGNTVAVAGDDGVQVYSVVGSVTGINNTVFTVGGGGGAGGDGIQIDKTGRFADIFGTFDIGNVTVANNLVYSVVGTGLDITDGLTAGDGIRLANIDGDIRVLSNRIGTQLNGVIYNDGVQIYNVNGAGVALTNGVTVSGNTIGGASSIGGGTPDGDGIVVENTGTYGGGPQGSGSVTISGNTIMNVVGTGAADRDVAVSYMSGRSSGDGIRTAGIDQNVLVSGNLIDPIGDDGFEAALVTGTVLAIGNTIDSVGNGSAWGDGIQITQVGFHFTGIAVASGVTVASNTITHVISAGGIDPDDGRHAGDGIRVTDVDGNVVVGGSTGTVTNGNTIQMVSDDGIQIDSINGNVLVSFNIVETVSNVTTEGDGIVVSNVGSSFTGYGGAGNVTVISNQIDHVAGTGADSDGGLTAGDGVRVFNVDGTVRVLRNNISTIGNDGIEVTRINGPVTVASNSVVNVGIGVDLTGDGINVGIVVGNVLVQSNTVSNVVDLDGIHVENVAGNISVDLNTITNVKDDGIQVTVINGAISVTSNTVSTIGGSGTGDGIDITVVSGGGVLVQSNTVSDVTDLDGIHVATVSTTIGVKVLNNRVTRVKDDGVEVTTVSGDVSVSSNTLTTIGGSTTGDGISVTIVSGNIQVQSNAITNVLDLDGVHVEIIAGNVLANNNSVNNVAGNGINVTTVSGGVTANGNSVANVGTAGGADGIIISSVINLVVVSANSIANASQDGIEVSNLSNGFSITNNSSTGSEHGLFIGNGAVSATPGVNVITGNVLTNNITWGLVVNTGNTAGETVLAGDTFPTLNIVLKGNTFTGNGGPPDATLSQGGAIDNRNLMHILDARGNNFGGKPFTTPTHFETPNSGGTGNAVSDWVRIDVTVPVVPPIPQIELLLNSFARGPHPLTPGDVLAIGPAFDQNGHLFDPYFVDIFGTPFGLSGNPAGIVLAIGPATDYGMCALADMWRVTSCRIVPPPQ